MDTISTILIVFILLNVYQAIRFQKKQKKVNAIEDKCLRLIEEKNDYRQMLDTKKSQNYNMSLDIEKLTRDKIDLISKIATSEAEFINYRKDNNEKSNRLHASVRSLTSSRDMWKDKYFSVKDTYNNSL